MKLPHVAPEDGETNNTSALESLEQTTSFKMEPAFSLSGEGTSFFSSDQVTAEATMPKQRRSLKGLWITLVVIFVLLAGAYVGFAVYFMNHFAAHTTINGIDVAFKTADEVDASLATEISSYKLQLEGRDQNAVINGSEVDLSYVADGRVAELLANQNPWMWPLAFFPQDEATMQHEHVSVEYDAQMLETVLSGLALMDTEQMVAPVDAHLAFEEGQYVIKEGDTGTTLDTEKTLDAVGEAISAGETKLDLDEADLYVKPTVAADDPTLVADRDRFNTYVPFQIVYTLGDRREVLDGYTTINWVNTEGEGPYYLDEAAVRAWIADFASRYDTLGATRTIINGFGAEKTVSGGTYGWQIDQESEYWGILNAAEQHLGEEREPYLLGSAASLGAQDWGSTYLEVDISEQHMWYVVDGVVVLETPVVTGNPNTGYSTPEGVWSIFMITTNMETKGDPLPEGGYSWGPTVVAYWMQFTSNGCGFHDADWQPYFGGDLYLYNGSHGCINMPPALAAQLYGMVQMGTPVITHY